tara:strand:+ start:270 stop:1394 length:1125 start_codon:yes stop_codon:yes gene_type:complete
MGLIKYFRKLPDQTSFTQVSSTAAPPSNVTITLPKSAALQFNIRYTIYNTKYDPFADTENRSDVLVETTDKTYIIYDRNGHNTDWFFTGTNEEVYIRVTYNLSGGTATGGSAVNTNYSHGQHFFLPSIVTLSGYYLLEFTGAFAGNALPGENVQINVRTDGVITAIYGIYYSYNFDLNGGSKTAGSDASTTKKYNDKVTLPTANKPGFNFSYYESDIGTTDTMGARITIDRNITCKIIWSIQKYNIQYVSNTPPHFNYSVTSVSYDYNTLLDDTIFTPNRPRVIGQIYNFLKWTYNSNDLGSLRLPANNIILNAIWTSSDKTEIKLNELVTVFDNSQIFVNIKVSDYFTKLGLNTEIDKKNVDFLSRLKGRGIF